MVRRLVLLLAATATAACCAGCGSQLEPKPLSEDQRHEFMEQLEEVRRMELEEP